MESFVINAIANPVRVKILCCLVQKTKNVEELVQTCGLAQSAISQHLMKLKKAELVRGVKKGKYIYYSIANKKIAKIVLLLKEYCDETIQV